MTRRAPDTSVFKHCCACKQFKPATEFNRNRSTYDKLQSACRDCGKKHASNYAKANREENAARARKWRAKNKDRSRDHGYKARYRLAYGTYAKMLEAQNGKCAICQTDTPGGKGRFHVDHCHTTGAVRGLLCHNCNVGLGNLRHDPELILSATRYLQASKVAV